MISVFPTGVRAGLGAARPAMASGHSIETAMPVSQ
jgi:hypothetical protein